MTGPQNISEAAGRPERWLVLLIGLQAVFLAITYAEGMWTALTLHNFDITVPEVIEHGLSSSGFALITGVVGFVAALRGLRRVAMSNLALFALTVIAGATGFSFLSNSTDPSQIELTNLSMITTVAIGMPITGYSLYRVSSGSKDEGGRSNPAQMVLTYLALGTLSATIIAGAAMLSTSPSWFVFAVSAHVGLAALLVSLVLGILLLSVTGETPTPRLTKVAYSLVALGSAAVAGADGVIYLTSGDISYVVIMSEVGVLVYIFLLIATGSSYRKGTGVISR